MTKGSERVFEWSEKTEDQLKIFVNENSDYYIKRWRPNSDKKIFFSWNWSALLFTFSWLIYRKMYFEFAVFLIITLPLAFFPNLFISMLSRILLASSVNCLYYKKAVKVIRTQAIEKRQTHSLALPIIVAIAFELAFRAIPFLINIGII